MSCPPKKSDYYRHQTRNLLMSFIPFVGPPASVYLPKVKDASDRLGAIHKDLETRVSDWRSEVSMQAYKNSKNLKDTFDLLHGDVENPGYVQLVAGLASESAEERSRMNRLDIVFIVIILAFVILYT